MTGRRFKELGAALLLQGCEKSGYKSTDLRRRAFGFQAKVLPSTSEWIPPYSGLNNIKGFILLLMLHTASQKYTN